LFYGKFRSLVKRIPDSRGSEYYSQLRLLSYRNRAGFCIGPAKKGEENKKSGKKIKR